MFKNAVLALSIALSSLLLATFQVQAKQVSDLEYRIAKLESQIAAFDTFGDAEKDKELIERLRKVIEEAEEKIKEIEKKKKDT